MSNYAKERFNHREILFIHYFLIHRNASKAATLAGYSKKTAGSQGARLLKNAKIKVEIDRRMGKLSKKLEITAENVLKEMSRLAFYDPADLYDTAGNLIPVKDLPEDTRRAIKGWDVDVEEVEYLGRDGKVTRRARTSSVKPRMADKRPVLRDLGQHLDLFDPDDEDKKRPINITVKIGGKDGGSTRADTD